MELRAFSAILVALAASCGGNAHESRSLKGQGGEPASSGGRAATSRGGTAGAAGAAEEPAGAGGSEDGPVGAAGANDAAGSDAADSAGASAECADEPGDCKHSICDENGNSIVVVDPSDVPEAEGPCFAPICTNDGPVMQPSAARSACEGGLCDGLGACVECLEDTDCAPDMACGQHSCVSEGACDDTAQNGSETAVDCGGSSCEPCDDGQACLIDQDCASDLCDALLLICLPFSCRDGTRDNDETDVDCGGETCIGCYVAEECLLDSDCVTNKCDQGLGVCVGNTCGDQRQDGSETDVDCGGYTCGPCGEGDKCHSNFDCNFLICNHNEKPARCR